MNYSYKPHYYFNYKEKNEQVYIGFENEINYVDSSTTTLQLQDIYKNYKASELYVKSDGSIKGSGFELVSMPMSYSFFKDFDLLTGLINAGQCQLFLTFKESFGCFLAERSFLLFRLGQQFFSFEVFS